MNLLTRDDLTELMNTHDNICLSIYMPTYRAGTETQQGRIRLKNLLREAEQRLTDSEMRSPEAKRFLAPIEDIIYDNQFWQQQRDGLAVFLSESLFYHYSLPLHFNEFLFIGQKFHLKPLLPLLSGDGKFYVLALSQNDVRVLQCTRASVKELEIDEIPHSLAEAMKYDDPERQLQFHTNTLESPGPRAAAIFHGHGVGPDDAKNNILRYCRLIDQGLHDLLREEKVPLVLVGVEFIQSIYRAANTYAYLADEGLPGNPEELSPEDLQTLTWPLVEHYFHKAEQEAVTYYGPFSGTGRTTTDICEAVPAAQNGRIEILFMADGVQEWGRFDDYNNKVNLHLEPQVGDEDLYNFTAMQTILNGGTVYIMDPAKIPDGKNLAALFRY